jgi:hypothetical protein
MRAVGRDALAPAASVRAKASAAHFLESAQNCVCFCESSVLRLPQVSVSDIVSGRSRAGLRHESNETRPSRHAGVHGLRPRDLRVHAAVVHRRFTRAVNTA